jgi:hypothetical protein
MPIYFLTRSTYRPWQPRPLIVIGTAKSLREAHDNAIPVTELCGFYLGPGVTITRGGEVYGTNRARKEFRRARTRGEVIRNRKEIRARYHPVLRITRGGLTDPDR